MKKNINFLLLLTLSAITATFFSCGKAAEPGPEEKFKSLISKSWKPVGRTLTEGTGTPKEAFLPCSADDILTFKVDNTAQTENLAITSNFFGTKCDTTVNLKYTSTLYKVASDGKTIQFYLDLPHAPDFENDATDTKNEINGSKVASYLVRTEEIAELTATTLKLREVLTDKKGKVLGNVVRTYASN